MVRCTAYRYATRAGLKGSFPDPPGVKKRKDGEGAAAVWVRAGPANLVVTLARSEPHGDLTQSHYSQVREQLVASRSIAGVRRPRFAHSVSVPCSGAGAGAASG